MTTKTSDIRYCKTCGRVLSSVTNEDGVFWIHQPSEALFGFKDHEPIPVAETPKADTRCDFCNTTNPTWVFPVTEQTEVGISLIGQDSSRTMSIIDDEWAACDQCKEIVLAVDNGDDLAEIMLRKMDKTSGKIPEQARAGMTSHLSILYGNVLDKMLDPVPLDEYEATHA